MCVLVEMMKRHLAALRDKLRNMPEKNKLLVLALAVGICSGLAAVLLESLVHGIKNLLTNWFDASWDNYLYLVYPGIGMLCSLLILRFFVKDNIGHGVTKVLLAVSRNESRIKPHNMWSSIVTSSLTIGFGGSVGAEAPIVYTGAAIGSNFARYMGMSYRNMTILLGCGAAGAVAGIFKAPLAGVLFTLEILLFNISMTSMMPLLLASVSATMVSYIFLGDSLPFECTLTPFDIKNVPFYILLGFFCGGCSLYFLRTTLWLEDKLGKMKSPYRKWFFCAAGLGLLIFLFPPLYGEGYDTIGSLLNGQFSHIMDKSLFYGLNDTYFGVVFFLVLILLTKVFASSATNAGGGCGGIFAPSLYLGCIAGFVFAHTSNFFPFTMYLSEKNFALLGMAGIMSGVMHAPLTGVFLIAELTGGYDLFLPLMIVSIGSYLTILMFEPHSIYSMRLAQKGELLTHHKDKAVLTLLEVDSVIEKDFQAVSPEMSLGDMVKVISHSTRNTFPVVDERGVLLGIVLLDNIRNIMFRPELYNRFKVSKFMVSAPAKILVNTPMDKIMETFDDTKAWNLPVVDERGHYIGFMSKSKIFNSYREVLVDNFSGD